MRLIVKRFDGWHAEFTVEQNASLDSLKELVITELGNTQLTISQVQLLYRNEEITQRYIRECGIKDGGELIVMVTERNTFQILVETAKGKKIQLGVESTELVENVKRMLDKEEGFSVDQQTLFYNGRKIDSGRLNHYSICNNSILQLKLRKIQVFLYDMKGTTHTLEISHDDTVDHLKELVKRKTSVSTSQQVLTYGSKQLENGRKLGLYKIQENGTIHLTGRLRGG